MFVNLLLQIGIALGPHLFNPRADAITVSVESQAIEACEVWVTDNVSYFNIFPSSPKRFHNIEVTGLTADTIYNYAVKMGTSWSGIYLFKTSGTSIRMMVWGDNQVGSGTFSSLLYDAMMRGCTQYVGLGDYIQNETLYSDWRTQFFDIIGPWARYVPILGTRGNHDGEDPLAMGLFPLLGNNEWCAFSNHGIRFLILDSNIDRFHLWNTMDPGGAQYTFVQNEVNSSAWKNADYRVVLFHHPHRTEQWDGGCYYGTNGTYVTINNLVTNILVPGGADIIFNGHSHSYQRGQIGTYTHHIISGGGGGWLDQNLCWDWPHITINAGVGNQFNHYLILDVSPLRLELTCVKLSGQIYDSFTIAPRRIP